MQILRLGEDMLARKVIAAPAIFDPFAAPWVLPAWHSRIKIVPAPEICGIYGREWPVGGPCCFWTGWNNGKGHGIVKIAQRRIYLHRYSYAQHYGCDVHVLNTVDHLCRNRPCFNPFHLEDTTHLENYQRGDGPSYQYKRADEYPPPQALSDEDAMGLLDPYSGYKK